MTTVWYFAYGSNMQRETLRGRRGIQFLRAVPARAAGWRLVFDKPALVPIGEAFANIVPDAGAHVLGVAYEVSEEDLRHIELTEGVLLGNYERVTLSVEPLSDSAPPLTAFSLASDHRDSNLQPSTHYMELVISGATEHGLPADYVESLRAVPAKPPTPEALRFRALLDEFLRR
jgi:cation transport regulator ChaC